MKLALKGLIRTISLEQNLSINIVLKYSVQLEIDIHIHIKGYFLFKRF